MTRTPRGPFLIALVGALISLGFSTAALVMPPGSSGAPTLAAYAEARSVAITVGVLLAWRSLAALRTMVLVVTLMQALDALVGLAQRDPGKTIGPIILGALCIVGWRRLREEI